MKIAIINTLYYPNNIGGAEISVQLLAEELVRKGHEVRVVCLHKERKRKKKSINNVEIVYLPLLNIYWPFDFESKNIFKRLTWHIIDSYNFGMARLVSREIDDFEPDVVHTNNISGFSVSIWGAIKSKNKKLIHTSRDYYLFHPNSTLFKKNRNMEPGEVSVQTWSFVKKIASRKVDAYVGISDFIRKFHTENGFFPKAESSYIYNAVEKIPVNNVYSEGLRFGFIGRLTKDKGFDIYCNLANKLKIKHTNSKFYAAGRFVASEYGDELEVLARANDVNLLGFIPVSKFLAQVDIVVLPIKWREPFGRVVLESVFANKVVLTNAVGGISELAEQFSTIYFMEDLDKINFSMKINEIENCKSFSYDEIASKYLSVYRY